MIEKIRIYDKETLLILLNKYHSLGYEYRIHEEYVEIDFLTLVKNINETFVPTFVGLGGLYVIYHLSINEDRKWFWVRGSHVSKEYLRKEKLNKIICNV